MKRLPYRARKSVWRWAARVGLLVAWSGMLLGLTGGLLSPAAGSWAMFFGGAVCIPYFMRHARLDRPYPWAFTAAPFFLLPLMFLVMVHVLSMIRQQLVVAAADRLTTVLQFHDAIGDVAWIGVAGLIGAAHCVLMSSRTPTEDESEVERLAHVRDCLANRVVSADRAQPSRPRL